MAKILPFSPHPGTEQRASEGPALPGRRADDIFVGREREMEELRASLDGACVGRGRLVLLAGEPGIGKTRTAYEMAAYARQRGTQVLFGRCYEGKGAPPFWPWVQIVRSYVSDSDPKTLRSAMGPGAADIAQVIAEVRERLPDLPTLSVSKPEQARFRFFDSLTTFLKNAAQAQPLVLILDDLQGADKPSLLLLQFVVRELGQARLLLIGTYRDVELRRQHPLTQTLGELAREQASQSISLRGLTEKEVAHFIELTIGVAPSGPLASAVYNKTEGNPFFVGEILRLLASGGYLQRPEELTSQNLALPQRVREVIGRRLDHLSKACSRVLTIASVIGRDFGFEVLKRTSGLPAERLLKVLEEAMAAHLVAAVPHSVGRYSSSHVLIRETLYEALSPVQRVRLHCRVGEILEDLHGTSLEPRTAMRLEQALPASSGQVLAELAHHFFAAAQGGGAAVDKAIAYATEAGEWAMRQLAYEEAAGHYERALQALQFQKLDEGQQCKLLLALGEAQAKGGDIPGAKESFRQAGALASKIRAPEQLARAALGFEAWLEPWVVNEVRVRLLEEALATLDERDSALRARVLGSLAQALYWSPGSRERRAALSREAVGMARRIGDPVVLAHVLSARHFALWEAENVNERLAIATEIIRLAEEVGDKELALQGRRWCLVALLELGDMTAANRAIEACAQLAEELRQPSYLSQAVSFQAMRALFTGQFEEGERLAQQALTIAQRGRNLDAALTFGGQMCIVRVEQERDEELQALIGDVVEQYPPPPSVRAELAWINIGLGRTAEARSEFERLAANDFSDCPQDMFWLHALTFLSQVCAFFGDTRRAATLYELLLPYAGCNAVVPAGGIAYGSTSRGLGLLAATMARWEEAVQHFEDALAMNAKMGARPWVAHTQYDYAHLLLARRQRGDRKKALKLLDQALATAQELGMQGLADKIKLSVASAQLPVKSSEVRIPPPPLRTQHSGLSTLIPSAKKATTGPSLTRELSSA